MKSSTLSSNYYDIEKLKEIPIQEVLSDFYGIESTKKGDHRAVCDIRGEKTPSCYLYLDTNTFCDFGDSNRGGNVINLVEHLSNVDFKEAANLLATRYGIIPEQKNARSFPTEHEFRKINIYSDRATKNFDFNIDKYGIKKTKEFSEKYAIPIKELSEKYPKVYHNMLRSKAIPYIDSCRNEYYNNVYMSHLLCSELGAELSSSMIRELREQIKDLSQMERIITRAILNKKLLSYKPKTYDVQSDLTNILNGTIEFQNGNVDYMSLKSNAVHNNKNLYFKNVPFSLFIDQRSNFDFDYAAYVNGRKQEVNIITDSENKSKLLKILNKETQIEQNQVVQGEQKNFYVAKEQEVNMPVQEKKYNTVVVNMFAGPGAGKTTCAWEIASALKKKGLITEYVSEVAKEYVWENNFEVLDGSVKNQGKLLEEQDRRIQRLMGKVEVIVTDSPILLNNIYLKEKNPEFESNVINRFKSQNNFNVFIDRGKKFETTGRIHDYADSIRIDSNIEKLLKDNNFYFKKYTHTQINRCIENINNYVKKVNGRPIHNKPTVQQDFITQYCCRAAKEQNTRQKELEVLR